MYVLLEIHSDIDNIVADLQRPYVFILISTVLTWARSKPVDPVNPFHNVVCYIVAF